MVEVKFDMVVVIKVSEVVEFDFVRISFGSEPLGLRQRRFCSHIGVSLKARFEPNNGQYIEIVFNL